MPRTFVGDVTSWRRIYLATNPSHVGVDVDGLACPCTILGSATVRRGDKTFCQVLSCLIAAVAVAPFWGM
jgi:hypothetical protein